MVEGSKVKIQQKIQGYYLNIVKRAINLYAFSDGIVNLEKIEKTIGGIMSRKDIAEAVNFLIQTNQLNQGYSSVNYF
jgi:hypothetical protein